MSDRERGVIKAFNPVRGFGFLRIPGRMEGVFFHVTQLRHVGADRPTPSEGDCVTCEVVTNERGLAAVDLAIVSPSRQERHDA